MQVLPELRGRKLAHRLQCVYCILDLVSQSVTSLPALVPALSCSRTALQRDPRVDVLCDSIDSRQSDHWLLARRLEDIHALTVLQPLMISQPLPPLTGSALRPYCLVHVLNDIIVNRRQRIIEFGTASRRS